MTYATKTQERKAKKELFRELVKTTPRGQSLGFGRDRARKQLRKEQKA